MNFLWNALFWTWVFESFDLVQNGTQIIPDFFPYDHFIIIITKWSYDFTGNIDMPFNLTCFIINAFQTLNHPPHFDHILVFWPSTEWNTYFMSVFAFSSSIFSMIMRSLLKEIPISSKLMIIIRINSNNSNWYSLLLLTF